MTEMRGGTGAPGPVDRLSMLRAGSGPLREPSPKTPRKMRVELWAGVLLVLGGVTAALVLRGGPAPSPSTGNPVPDSTAPLPAAPSDGVGILAGEVVVAFAVSDGDYPPSLRAGDEVRLIVTPGSDGTGDVRPLVERTIVVSVDPTSATGQGRVISVRGPESIATAVAGSGPVHVAIVGGAQP